MIRSIIGRDMQGIGSCADILGSAEDLRDGANDLALDAFVAYSLFKDRVKVAVEVRVRMSRGTLLVADLDVCGDGRGALLPRLL
jgi:hypothetical protein